MFTKRSSTAISMGLFLLAVGGLLFLLRAPLRAADSSVRSVYLDKCSVCHAEDGSGHTAKGRKVHAKDLRSAEVQKLSDPEMLKDIENGKGKDMDGFKKELGPEMCKELAVYMRQIGK